MAVDFQRPDYASALPIWREIDDLIFGRNLDRFLREFTAPDNAPPPTRERARKRTKEYREGAVFYGIAGYTFRGMVGAMFRKDPRFQRPAALDYLERNADGAGNSIYQQAQSLAGDVVSKARAGLFVAFPPTDGGVSRADLAAGRAFATLHAISPEQIINWRVQTIGGETRLALVVFTFSEDEVAPDGFASEPVTKYRHLALEDGRYVDRVWRETQRGAWEIERETAPTDGSGAAWREIPFIFVGSENNDPSIDPAPMLDICRVNKGHYRNSAELEDSIAIAGQAQPWASGVDDAWMRDMQEQGFQVGSRVLLPLPEGGQFAFASADPNPIVRQAMLDKVDQMIGLGARFIQPGSAAKTATQAESESEIQHSVLSLIAANVSEAYTAALAWAARYMAATGDVTFEVNRDFGADGANPQELTSLVASWVQGAIPASDMWAWMQSRGLISPDKTIDDIANEIAGGGDTAI